MLRMRRFLRSFSLFLNHLFVALVRAVVTSMIVGIVVVSIMHYMGVPIPSALDLFRGVSKLADALS